MPSGNGGRYPRGEHPGVRRGPPERLAAWIATGPLGHLYGWVAELAVVAAGQARRRSAPSKLAGRPNARPGAEDKV